MNERVVSAEWVAESREDDAVRLVDVREPWEYESIGQLPGAVNIPFDRFRADEHGEAEAGMLPGAETFGDLLGGAGIDRDSRLVAYDDTHGVFAARFIVTAELYGHDPDRLHLLDGDYSAWSRQFEVAQDPPTVEPTDYPAAFDPGGPLVDIDVVQAAIDGDAVLVDVREPWEFEEGHLPGAVQLDWLELVDDDTRGLHSDEALRTLLADRGIVPDRRILLYCNTARRLSHTYIVLRALGYEDVAFYEGSLVEWTSIGGELVEEAGSPE